MNEITFTSGSDRCSAWHLTAVSDDRTTRAVWGSVMATASVVLGTFMKQIGVAQCFDVDLPRRSIKPL
jgi:hypothetical protein